MEATPLSRFREKLEELSDAKELVHVHTYGSGSGYTGLIIVHSDYVEVVSEGWPPVLIPIDKIVSVAYACEDSEDQSE